MSKKINQFISSGCGTFNNLEQTSSGILFVLQFVKSAVRIIFNWHEPLYFEIPRYKVQIIGR